MTPPSSSRLSELSREPETSKLARDTGMTREGLCKAFSGEGNPTFATVMKVAKALDLKLTLQAA